MSRLKQHEKILYVMFSGEKGQWFYPVDFMRPEMGEYFVGYEASARLSELARDYPDMITSERDGKFMKRRINFETSSEWYPKLPANLKEIAHRARANHHYEVAKAVQRELF